MHSTPAAAKAVPVVVVAGYVPAGQAAIKAVLPEGATAVLTAMDVPPAQMDPGKKHVLIVGEAHGNNRCHT